MTRKDFVERGELKVDFLKHYRLVSRWACRTHDLQVADLELLFYLDPIMYFTTDDFRDGTLFYSWDKKRFQRLKREDWIEKTFGGNKKGNKAKYKVSSKGKRLITRIYKILIGQEDIPESVRRNRIMIGETYTDKVYRQAIKKFNRNKD